MTLHPRAWPLAIMAGVIAASLGCQAKSLA
jgi:hypothetical protein